MTDRQPEIDDLLKRLRIMASLAAGWQRKYSECKSEISILRARKNHYKSEFLKCIGKTPH